MYCILSILHVLFNMSSVKSCKAALRSARFPAPATEPRKSLEDLQRLSESIACQLGRHARVVRTVTDDEGFTWTGQGGELIQVPILKHTYKKIIVYIYIV